MNSAEILDRVRELNHLFRERLMVPAVRNQPDLLRAGIAETITDLNALMNQVNLTLTNKISTDAQTLPPEGGSLTNGN